MKKIPALFMILVLISSFIVGFTVPASAKVQFVEEAYSYDRVVDEFGNVDGLKFNEEFRSYDSKNGFSFCNGLWSYEYYLTAEKEFKPMTGYFRDNYLSEGWGQGNWNNIYVADPSAAWTDGGLTYCGILGYKYMHPGEAAGAVITYTVPASGTITYDFSIFANSDSNHPNAYPGENWGTLIYVYINEKQVYPASNAASNANRIGSHNTSKLEPLEVSLNAIKVNEGDKIRLVAVAYNGYNEASGVYFASCPLVTYHSAVVPVGNPNGTPPSDLIVDVGRNTNNTTVTWSEATNAAGYNVYLKKAADNGDPVKVNTAAVAETTFTLTRLDAETMYEVYVTTVTAAGNESAFSDAYIFKTKKGSGNATTDNSNVSGGGIGSNTTDNGASNSNNNAGNNNAGNSTDAGNNNNVSTDKNASDYSATNDNSANNVNSANGANNNANENNGVMAGSPVILWVVVVAASFVMDLIVAAVVLILIFRKKKAAFKTAEEPKDAE